MICIQNKYLFILITIAVFASLLLVGTILFLLSDKTIDSSHETTVSYSVINDNISYEYYLAASVFTGIHMEYQNPIISGIYSKSETSIANCSESAGVYITFENEGSKHCIYSMPLFDKPDIYDGNYLYTENFGYASFDEIDYNSFSETNMTALDVEVVCSLIPELNMLTVY